MVVRLCPRVTLHYKNVSDKLRVKGKFPYTSNNQKRDHEGTLKQSTSLVQTTAPTEQNGENEEFQRVNKNKRRGGCNLLTINSLSAIRSAFVSYKNDAEPLLAKNVEVKKPISNKI